MLDDPVRRSKCRLYKSIVCVVDQYDFLRTMCHFTTTNVAQRLWKNRKSEKYARIKRIKLNVLSSRVFFFYFKFRVTRIRFHCGRSWDSRICSGESIERESQLECAITGSWWQSTCRIWGISFNILDLNVNFHCIWCHKFQTNFYKLN